MANRVLILTDRNYHRERDSLFPIAAHLAENALIEKIWVADRSDPANDGFYQGLDTSFSRWRVRPVDADFAMANAMDDTLRPASFIGPDDFDAVWIRLEWPVSDEFLEYLRNLLPDKFMVNDPRGLIQTMSKEFLVELPPVLGELLPKVSICDTAQDVDAMAATCKQGVVLKQVRSNGGKGVTRYRPGLDTDLHNLEDVAAYLSENGRCVAMEYLNPTEGQSDNRVLVMNGVVIGVVQRLPQEGSWICNLSSGGTAVDTEISPQGQEVVRRIDPIMRRHGIFLYGLDMLKDDNNERRLSEINTLNVGAIAVSERLQEKPITKFVADNLAAVINARDFHIATVGNEILSAKDVRVS